MKPLDEYLAVAGAGAVGAVLRLWVSRLCGKWFLTDFPVGTLVINLSGSFFLGWFATVTTQRMIMREELRLAIAVGFVGAYTTFSTFTYESTVLLQKGAFNMALGNLIGSLLLGLLAAWAGVWLGQR